MPEREGAELPRLVSETGARGGEGLEKLAHFEVIGAADVKEVGCGISSGKGAL